MAWAVLLTSAAIMLSSNRVPHNPRLTYTIIGGTLLLSAYTLLALVVNLQNQVRALKTAENRTDRKLWLTFQVLLIGAAAAAIIWSAWPK